MLKKISIAMLAVMVSPLWCIAQQGAGGDVTVRSQPEGAQVTLAGPVTVSGVTPARFQQLLVGEFDLTLQKYGYETYSSRVVLDPSKQMEIDVKLSRKTRLKAAARSVFIPGWGQKYTDQKTKSFLFAVLAAGSAVAYLIADHDFGDKKEIHDNIRRQYDSLYYVGSLEDLRRLKPRLDQTQNEAYDAENVRRATIGVAAAIWAVNVLDVVLFFPQEQAGYTVKGMAVRPTADLNTVGVKITKAF